MKYSLEGVWTVAKAGWMSTPLEVLKWTLSTRWHLEHPNNQRQPEDQGNVLTREGTGLEARLVVVLALEKLSLRHFL